MDQKVLLRACDSMSIFIQPQKLDELFKTRMVLMLLVNRIAVSDLRDLATEL